MKSILIAASAAAILSAATAANAQECVNGFRMLGNQVPVPCGGAYYAPEREGYYAAPERDGYYEVQPGPEAPFITGSIGRPYYAAEPYYYYEDRPYYAERRHYRRHYREPHISFGVGFGFGGGDCWGNGFGYGPSPYC